MMRTEAKETGGKGKGFDNTATTAISAVLASYKRHCPILSVTRFDRVARQMQLYRGCIPLMYEKERAGDWMKDVDERVQYAIDFGKRSNFISTGDSVVVITGWRQGSGSSNTVRILAVE